MKKIYIDKNDSASAVVEKVMEEADDEIILYIPRFTKLVSSISNFRVLKREFDSADKNIEIESVDDDVLEMARAVNIKAGNPFFRKNRRSVSDIVMRSDKKEEDDKEEDQEHVIGSAHHKARKSGHGRRHASHRKKRSFLLGFGLFGSGRLRNVVMAIFVIAVLLGGFVLAVKVLPKAEVSVVMEKFDWTFEGNIVASVSNTENSFDDGEARVIAEMLSKNKNITLAYPASGEEEVEERATGRITIYNAYSSDPQPIVATTRFAAPDGKIYRITEQLTIPGAVVVDSEIVPSSIEADVVADEPGEEYNIGPTRFTIPGFEGGPRYEGFYAESSSFMSGGIAGRVRVATESDIEEARANIRTVLENQLREELRLISPPNIKLIDGSTNFVINEIDVDRIADMSGNFKVTGVGTIRAIGFNEENLFEALEIKLIDEIREEAVLNNNEFIEDEFSLVLKDGYTLNYGAPQMNFTNQTMLAPLDMTSVWARALDVDEFKSNIAGKTQRDLSSGPLPAPGIRSLSVSLWPFWVRTIPDNLDKITVDVR